MGDNSDDLEGALAGLKAYYLVQVYTSTYHGKARGVVCRSPEGKQRPSQ
jgi:hypothetical protein